MICRFNQHKKHGIKFSKEKIIEPSPEINNTEVPVIDTKSHKRIILLKQEIHDELEIHLLNPTKKASCSVIFCAENCEANSNYNLILCKEVATQNKECLKINSRNDFEDSFMRDYNLSKRRGKNIQFPKEVKSTKDITNTDNQIFGIPQDEIHSPYNDEICNCPITVDKDKEPHQTQHQESEIFTVLFKIDNKCSDSSLNETFVETSETETYFTSETEKLKSKNKSCRSIKESEGKEKEIESGSEDIYNNESDTKEVGENGNEVICNKESYTKEIVESGNKVIYNKESDTKKVGESRNEVIYNKESDSKEIGQSKNEVIREPKLGAKIKDSSTTLNNKNLTHTKSRPIPSRRNVLPVIEESPEPISTDSSNSDLEEDYCLVDALGRSIILFDHRGLPLTDGSGRPLKSVAGELLLKCDADGIPVVDEKTQVFDMHGRQAHEEEFQPWLFPQSQGASRLTTGNGLPLVLFDVDGRPLTSISGTLLVDSSGRSLLNLKNCFTQSTSSV